MSVQSEGPRGSARTRHVAVHVEKEPGVESEAVGGTAETKDVEALSSSF